MSETETRNLRLMEALLFASPDPLSEAALGERLPEDADIEALLGELRATYAERGVNLERRGKGWVFRTAPDLGGLLQRERVITRKLSRAAVETMAIIAYHQPVTRAEIEDIRGVSLSKGILDGLFEAGWIRPKGRRRTPGRPVTWGTTDGFLDHFAIESLDDLPGTEELKAAGLLDKRPAIQAFAKQGKLDLVADGGDVDEEGEDEMPEPLDPDDGALPQAANEE